MGKSIGMKDIALSLGISVDAVSKALRNTDDISLATKEKVRAKAVELGYVKDRAAVALKAGMSKNVAVYINNLINPYSAVATDFIIRGLVDRGYVPLVSFSPKFVLDESILSASLGGRPCMAISLIEPTGGAMEVFRKAGIPFFLIGIYPRNPLVHYAISDDFKGGRLVAERFMASPYTKALFITDSPSETSERRLRGFIDGSKGKEVIPLPYGSPDKVIKQAINAIQKEDISFVFAYSDYLGFALRRALKDEGYQKEVEIIGYDDISTYEEIFEPLPSVGCDLPKMVKKTIEWAIASIEGGDEGRMEEIYPVYLKMHGK